MGREQLVRAMLMNGVREIVTDYSVTLGSIEIKPIVPSDCITSEVSITVQNPTNVDISCHGFKYIDVYKPKEYKVNRLMRRSSFQGRLGRYVDNISRIVSDNSIRLSSHPTDMIRIRANRDSRSQDLISRTIIGAEIVPILLPTMKDVPLRQFTRENKQDVLIPSYYPINDTEFYTIYAPLDVRLDEDDILLRMIYHANCDEPYVMALQVKEILSTVGYSSIIYNKFNVTFYDEELPDEIIRIIREANMKRDILGW